IIPGPRAARLQELYAQSLRRTLGKLKWENFAACYPTVASRAEPVLRQVQVQMVEKLGDKCEKEFESILAARQVVPKLNDLEALISEATHRRITAPPDAPKPTPPHLLPAREILSAHLAPSLASHQSLLNARLQTAQSHNAILYDQIRAQRAEIEQLLEMLEGTVGDVRSANEALEPVVELLAREAR
ncbi:Nnf1-domain-containing protein, partial [Trichoderma citrinoviride]